jgi:hypothetical protein
MKKKYSDFSHSELDIPISSDPALLEMADKFGVSHTGSFGLQDWGLLSSIELEELSELQIFALNFIGGKLGSTQFNDLSRLKRIAASRRITLAIRNSDVNILAKRFDALELTQVAFAMLSIRLVPRIDAFLGNVGAALSYLPGGNTVRRGFHQLMARIR